MGDRASISFKDQHGQESVTLFSHWGGQGFFMEANNYVNRLRQRLISEKRTDGCLPIDRLEPNTVMVDFIRHLTSHLTEVDSDLYLGATSEDGDNSDNGHKVIYLMPVQTDFKTNGGNRK